MNSAYTRIADELRDAGVMLVAVSKTKPASDILRLYDAGQRDFGENRVQELREKYDLLPKDIRWHLIGHLQTNKVKYVAPWVHLIHSIDSRALLEEVNRQGERNNRVIDCLLQVFIASEETKFGLSDDELNGLLEAISKKAMTHIRICGLMGMATNTDDMVLVRREFSHLKHLFDKIKHRYFKDADHFRHLSMGMSSDYLVAVEQGSTMVRIGSLLFGERT